MKKLILTSIVALAASLSLQAQPVYSNIVGMIKHELPVDGLKMVSLQFPVNATSIALGDAFSDIGDGSILYVWDNSTGYTKYTYFEGFGWYEGVTVANSVEITIGTAMWLNDSGLGSTAIQSGNVPETASYSVDVVVGLNMVANPYPTSLALGDIDVSGLTDQDIIYLWTGSGYTKYTYFEGFGWYEGVSDASTVEIPAGQGVWLSAQSVGTITFTKPY